MNIVEFIQIFGIIVLCIYGLLTIVFFICLWMITISLMDIQKELKIHNEIQFSKTMIMLKDKRSPEQTQVLSDHLRNICRKYN